MLCTAVILFVCFFFQAEDGIRDVAVTGVQTCALPICPHPFIRSFEPGEDWFYSYETKETYEGPELAPPQHHPVGQGVPRSEERRVGKEWRSQRPATQSTTQRRTSREARRSSRKKQPTQ